MAEVVSFRLKNDPLNHIYAFSKQQDTDKTTAATNLIEYGWRYVILQEYREGKRSFEQAAKALHMSLLEFQDILVHFGIPSPITYEDYLLGLETMKKIK